LERLYYILLYELAVLSFTTCVSYLTRHSLFLMVTVSSVISECACGCARNEAPAPVSTREKRDSPPRNFQYEEIVARSETADGKRCNSQGGYPNNSDLNTSQRQEMMKHCHLPSGLSVEESEPELESTTGY
jgi:hypothetical protein